MVFTDEDKAAKLNFCELTNITVLNVFEGNFWQKIDYLED